MTEKTTTAIEEALNSHSPIPGRRRPSTASTLEITERHQPPFEGHINTIDNTDFPPLPTSQLRERRNGRQSRCVHALGLFRLTLASSLPCYADAGSPK